VAEIEFQNCRPVSGVITTVTDPQCSDTMTCAMSFKLVFTTRYSHVQVCVVACRDT